MSEKFFDIIKDGEWHKLNEIADELDVPLEKVIKLSRYASQQHILEYQEVTQEIRIKAEWKQRLPEEKFTS